MGEADPQVGPDWERLGRAVQRRREVLGVTQEEVAAAGGPSVATLRTIENAQGESYRSRTLYLLDTALGWHKGTAIAIANGQTLLWHKDVDGMIEEVVHTVRDSDRERYDVLVTSSHRLREASTQASKESAEVEEEPALNNLTQRALLGLAPALNTPAEDAYTRAAELARHLPLAQLRRLQGVVDATLAQRELQQRQWVTLFREMQAAGETARRREKDLNQAIAEYHQNENTETAARVEKLRTLADVAQEQHRIARARLNDVTRPFSELFDAPFDDVLPGEH